MCNCVYIHRERERERETFHRRDEEGKKGERYEKVSDEHCLHEVAET